MSNTRIKELFEQAKTECFTMGSKPGITVGLDELDRFAELIVRECMEQVWYSREDGINGNVSEVIKERMKQHFGVE